MSIYPQPRERRSGRRVVILDNPRALYSIPPTLRHGGFGRRMACTAEVWQPHLVPHRLRVILAVDCTAAGLQRPTMLPLLRHARQPVPIQAQRRQRGQRPDVAPQVKFENEVRKQYIVLHIQALISRRFHRRVHRVNLHRPTPSSAGTLVSWLLLSHNASNKGLTLVHFSA